MVLYHYSLYRKYLYHTGFYFTVLCTYTYFDRIIDPNSNILNSYHHNLGLLLGQYLLLDGLPHVSRKVVFWLQILDNGMICWNIIAENDFTEPLTQLKPVLPSDIFLGAYFIVPIPWNSTDAFLERIW